MRHLFVVIYDLIDVVALTIMIAFLMTTILINDALFLCGQFI